MIPLGILASSADIGAADPYELISTTVLGATATSVSFSSIPSTYKHLQIRTVANAASTSNITVRFNDDSGNNYAWHRLLGSGSAASSTGSASVSQGLIINGADSLANRFGAGLVDIVDYANTSKYKTMRALSGITGSNTTVSLTSSLWMSTAAITSITLAVGTNFSAASRFSLYGIK